MKLEEQRHKKGSSLQREEVNDGSINEEDISSLNVYYMSSTRQWTPWIKLRKCWHWGFSSQMAGNGLCGIWGLKDRDASHWALLEIRTEAPTCCCCLNGDREGGWRHRPTTDTSIAILIFQAQPFSMWGLLK